MNAPVLADLLAVRLGKWSGWWAAISALGFLAGVFLAILVFEEPEWTGDVAAYAAGYDPLAMAVTVVPSLFIAPGFLGLTIAIHAVAAPRLRAVTMAAVALAVVYLVTVGTNYLIQLTVVRHNFGAGITEDLSLLAMANPRGIFYALEGLGYFWQTVAAFLASFAFDPRAARWIRWSFGVVIITGFMGVYGLVLGLEFIHPLMIGGSVVWSVAFPAGSILCARAFARMERGVPAGLAA